MSFFNFLKFKTILFFKILDQLLGMRARR